MSTEHAAICYDCTYHGEWTDELSQAHQDRVDHEEKYPVHKIRVTSRTAKPKR